MSKILITFYQPTISNNTKNLICYYEGFIKELKKAGNDIYVVNVAPFGTYGKNKRLALIKEEAGKIKNFSPDLIITFNNQCFEEFIVNTNCPIALFDADSVDLFVNVDFIKKYNDRYFMITNYKGWENQYKALGFSKEQICSIHPATAVQREDLEKDKNISFIGSNFYCKNEKFLEYTKNNHDKSVYSALTYFWKNKDYNYQEILNKHCNKSEFTVFDAHSLFDSRIFILSSLLDLGLELYGMGWERLADTNFALYSSFNKEPKFSLQQNQDIYNSSKINISISHPQTNGYAFPWRIYDIMASSGMLISSQANLLNKHTKGFVKIPMYSSPYDARDLCKKYLKEENLRNEIILASNEFIEKHGRWIDNFKILQEFLGVKMINGNKELGNIHISNFKNIENIENSRFKTIYYSAFIFVSCLPLFESLISTKKRKKIYKSFEKYKWSK